MAECTVTAGGVTVTIKDEGMSGDQCVDKAANTVKELGGSGDGNGGSKKSSTVYLDSAELNKLLEDLRAAIATLEKLST